MKQTGNWKERITESLTLSAQALPGIPLIEILGQNRVLIEHHRGVTRYGKEQICVKTGYGHIRVEGCGMELAKMTGEQLIIRGRIRSVHLEGREAR